MHLKKTPQIIYPVSNLIFLLNSLFSSDLLKIEKTYFSSKITYGSFQCSWGISFISPAFSV
jgi:hypothetical protein